MKLLYVLPFAMMVSACNSSKVQTPQLNEGVPSEIIIHKSESFLRGVKGSYNTSPRGRPSAILDVSYRLECAEAGETSAKERALKAGKILDEEYVVAEHLYFNNPRERGNWTRAATRKIFDETQCQVNIVTFEIKTEDTLEVLTWALANGVKPTNKK